MMEALATKADVKSVDNISQNLKKLQERVDKIEASNPCPPSAQGKNNLTTQINEALSEEKDREKRKLNIMIGGVKESKAASAQDKRVEDTTTVKKLLEDIGVAATPESVQRVGKPNEEKPRILLVPSKRAL